MSFPPALPLSSRIASHHPNTPYLTLKPIPLLPLPHTPFLSSIPGIAYSAAVISPQKRTGPSGYLTTPRITAAPRPPLSSCSPRAASTATSHHSQDFLPPPQGLCIALPILSRIGAPNQALLELHLDPQGHGHCATPQDGEHVRLRSRHGRRPYPREVTTFFFCRSLGGPFAFRFVFIACYATVLLGSLVQFCICFLLPASRHSCPLGTVLSALDTGPCRSGNALWTSPWLIPGLNLDPRRRESLVCSAAMQAA